MKQDFDQSLSQFIGAAVPIPLRAPGYEVHLIQLRQVPTINRCLAPLRKEFEHLAQALAAAQGEGADLGGLFDQALAGIDVMQILEEHRPLLLELLAEITRRTPDEIDSLELDDLLGLLAAAVELNLDFFFLRLQPQLRASLVELAVAISSRRRSS
ncbi:hypothetical protein [Metapseudomonas otitidis]|uniref:hypothetical protein n=1 Tax=Metapseudomonas otitidis TaxID=319939 RepID=UPI00209A9C90|nr:hypothetical protein [Pseudomonas otitidis]MCO7557451.1 hypothetical protein [Pseudomonas otitidis]